eukprot:1751706-Lingulodinium_polyedra.AAC.1
MSMAVQFSTARKAMSLCTPWRAASARTWARGAVPSGRAAARAARRTVSMGSGHPATGPVTPAALPALAG